MGYYSRQGKDWGKKLHNDSVALSILPRNLLQELFRAFIAREIFPRRGTFRQLRTTLLNPAHLFRYFHGGKQALRCRYYRCNFIRVPARVIFSFNALRYQSRLCRTVFLFLCLFFFIVSSASLFASLLAFHAYTRAHSGIPHRRNNYYYESDPGQETTIVFSFLLLVLPIPSSFTTRLPRWSLVDPTQNPRGLFYSRLVSSHLRPVDGTVRTLGGLHQVIITAKVGETPLENWTPRNNSLPNINRVFR